MRPREYDEGFAAEFERPVHIPARRGIPETIPYTWADHEAERDTLIRLYRYQARERAREVIRGELRAGAGWIPAGFTEADLDALPGVRL